MGWAARANQRTVTIPRDLALIRSFLKRHPEQLKPLMEQSSQPWDVVKAWMAELDVDAAAAD